MNYCYICGVELTQHKKRKPLCHACLHRRQVSRDIMRDLKIDRSDVDALTRLIYEQLRACREKTALGIIIYKVQSPKTTVARKLKALIALNVVFKDEKGYYV